MSLHNLKYRSLKKPIALGKAIMLTALCLITFNLCAQYKYSIRNFNAENGLPQNEITAMAIDFDGYLWLGTRSGLVRYDGLKFNTFLFDTANADPVRNIVQHIMNIPADKKTMVRARSGAVYSIEGGIPVPYSDTMKNTNYYYDIQGYFPSLSLFGQFNLPIWKLTTAQEWNERELSILPVSKTDFIVAGKNNRILLYYKNGARQKDIQLNAAFTAFITLKQYSFITDSLHNMYLYDAGGGMFKKVNLDLSMADGSMLNMRELSFHSDAYSGEAWCFNNAMLYMLRFDAARNLVSFIPQFSLAQQNHLWKNIVYDSINSTFFLSTLNEGLFQIRLKKIRTVNTDEKQPTTGKAIAGINYSILKTNDSTALTPGGFQFSAGVAGMAVKKLGNISGNRETIGLMPDGSILCPNSSQLFYYGPQDGYRTPHAYNDSFNRLSDSYVMLAYPEGDSVWVGTNRAVYCLTKKKVNTIFERTKDEKSVYFGLHLFYRLTNDEAFISNPMGFYKLKTLAPYSIDTIHFMDNKHVRHISRYKDAMILSVYKHGLYVYKNNSFYKVPVSEDMQALNTCHSTYIDVKENIWVPTDKGLFRSSASSVVASALHGGAAPFFFSYGKDDGIENMEFNGAGSPSYAVFKNGQLFYPSMGGIVTFNPSDLNDKIIATPVSVEKIVIDNNEVTGLTGSIHLQAGFKYLLIDLSVPHFGESRNLLLEYKLDNDEWKRIPVTGPLRITLVGISSGTHKLVIRKRTGFGDNEYAVTTLTIFRAKHVYEKWWFYPAMLITACLLFWLFVRLRTQSINKTRKVLQKKVDDQTTELSKEVETKDLLISIISHDMVAPLRHVAIVAKTLNRGLEKDPEKINQATSDIQTTSERILSGSNTIINWMKYNNKRIEINKQLINLHGLVNEAMDIHVPIAKNKNIAIVNDVPGAIFITADHNILSIILTNIISNAVKNTDKGTVRIFTESNSHEGVAVLKITDTGRGMNKQKLSIIQQVLKGNLEGLKSDERTSGLGFLMIAELQRIHDLTVLADSEMEKGTTLSIFINNSNI